MLQKMKLTALIGLGFASILTLLVIISGTSWFGLNTAYTGFVEYRGLARDTNLAGRVQANMLMMRLGVLKYLNERSPAALESYRNRVAILDELMAEARKEIQQPERARLVASASKEVVEYKKGFDRVLELLATRNQLVSDILEPAGLTMRQQMSEIMKSAYADDDASAAYYAGQVQEHLLLGRLYVVKYLITNTQKDYDRAIQEMNETLPPLVSNLDSNLQNPTRRAHLRKFKEEYTRYTGVLADLHTSISERNVLITDTLGAIGSKVAGELEQVKLSVKADQDELGPKVQAQTESTVTLVLLTSLFSIALGGALAWVVTQAIRRPIGGEPSEIANITQAIADGDLSQQLSVSEKDSGIYRSVCDMSNMLKELIGKIVQTSQHLSENAEEATRVSGETRQTIEDQQHKTTSVAAAINEMATSIQEVVRHASESATLSNDGLSQVDRGKETVDSTLSEIGLLAKNLEDAVGIIKSLEQSSSDIGSVIEVIQNISEQTNLLALNAAIEAARAGEQGRGFAVVADEVRSLAKRTQESTTEIQDMVQRLQSGTLKAVNAMEASHQQAQTTVTQSQETGQALEQIHQVISNISNMNIQVAAAVEEQSAVAGDVARDIENISSGFVETASGAERTSEASLQVTDMSNQLEEMTSHFKV